MAHLAVDLEGVPEIGRSSVSCQAPQREHPREGVGSMAGSHAVDEFWRSFVDATGIDGPHTAWSFGNDPGMATELGLLVRDGPKRATTSLLSWYEGDDAEPLPHIGELSVVLGGSDNPLCVIRTTDVEVRPFGRVDEAFAWVEGEGDRSLAHWRNAHVAFFASERRPVDEETPVVLETFELLWPAGPAS